MERVDVKAVHMKIIKKSVIVEFENIRNIIQTMLNKGEENKNETKN